MIAAKSTRARAILALVTALAGVACGGTKKEAAEPEPADVAEPSPPSDPEPAGVAEDGGGPTVEPATNRDKVREQDYEITHNDCEALAIAYARAWENDEIEKLDEKKLAEKAFQSARDEIETGKQHMHDDWLGECIKTVGTAYLYKNLQCATKARTMQRFDDCWNGKVQEE
jgi:hypothetical protein